MIKMHPWPEVRRTVVFLVQCCHGVLFCLFIFYRTPYRSETPHVSKNGPHGRHTAVWEGLLSPVTEHREQRVPGFSATVCFLVAGRQVSWQSMQLETRHHRPHVRPCLVVSCPLHRLVVGRCGNELVKVSKLAPPLFLRPSRMPCRQHLIFACSLSQPQLKDNPILRRGVRSMHCSSLPIFRT